MEPLHNVYYNYNNINLQILKTSETGTGYAQKTHNWISQYQTSENQTKKKIVKAAP